MDVGLLWWNYNNPKMEYKKHILGCSAVLLLVLIGWVIVYMMICSFCEQPNGASLQRSCRKELWDATIFFPFVK